MQALDEAYEAQERRMDARFALVCSTLANIHRGKGKPAYRVEDFLPKQRPKTQEELEAKVERFARAMKARVIHPE
ncbi:MAG: phage tail assembly protein T [Opitutales bacterium]